MVVGQAVRDALSLKFSGVLGLDCCCLLDAQPSSQNSAGVDAVLIHSILDTIPGPTSLLGRMGGARGLVRQNGGLLVVVSGYDWNDEVTPRGSWLGGFDAENGKKVRAPKVGHAFVTFSPFRALVGLNKKRMRSESSRTLHHVKLTSRS